MADYDGLARFMTRFPEHLICRRFGRLGTKRLLYMQAELSHLEEELDLITDYDPSTFATSWNDMKKSSEDNAATSQYQKMLEISEKLDKYQASLLQTVQVMSIPSPKHSELGFLRYWLNLERGGNRFLKGIESDPYYVNKRVDHTEDLVTLSPTADKDPFAQLLSDKLVDWYHRLTYRKRGPVMDGDIGRLWEYKHQIFTRVGDVICAMLSSIIPTTSIFLLYYVSSVYMKLLVVVVMSFLFSFVMAVVIGGRRVDVFAASTAFAAVQVVFISGVSIVPKH